ncbi:hypothetical protein TNIN_206701 [Trichonephila inaurata madagascariensis]|uniref:Uncharacterized protein n=1 Tax=Trichonephila inaurata madagascariensis TaxID=2747483 RepID=A0A8X6WMM0_9ARAC|nr:hypothetical protein TNIN_206701 [Trichonephila inaurata madagascariensis]
MFKSRKLVTDFKKTGQPMFQEDWSAYVPRRLVSLCSKKTADPNQNSTKTSRRFVSSRLSDIDLLLGAHALGLIYTGKLIKLECGLTVVETHLGFALLGKDTKINQAKSLSTVHEKQKPRSTMSMLSNQILGPKKKWGILGKTIRIRDPVENLKERELNSEFIKRFEGSTWLYRERVRGLDNDKHRS